ncbi:MAG: hypothetical protein R3C59_31170 [Planctomycetaceae bacterium]
MSAASRLTEEFNSYQWKTMQKFFREYCFAPIDGELGTGLPQEVIGQEVALTGAYILNDFQRMPDVRDPATDHQPALDELGERLKVQPIAISEAHRPKERCRSDVTA